MNNIPNHSHRLTAYRAVLLGYAQTNPVGGVFFFFSFSIFLETIGRIKFHYIN